MVWQTMTSGDVPEFIDTLRRFPLAISDDMAFPLQFYTLRVVSRETYYVKVPQTIWMALDPIIPHQAVIHFIKNTTYRHRKQNLLDIGENFIQHCFKFYDLERLTLTVVEGARSAWKIAHLLNFQHEGTIRRSKLIHGVYYDVHLFGRLRDVYRL